MKILVTGAAGFIGMHVCERLLARGDGLSASTTSTTTTTSHSRKRGWRGSCRSPVSASRSSTSPTVPAWRGSLPTKSRAASLTLGAQAGVRYSLQNPQAYAESNLVGFLNILEGCRHGGVEHLAYASSSSVGENEKVPFSESDNVDRPISLYAATKKANELMAHAYSHLYGFPATGLRFFTVYGPWGRPDMAYFGFTRPSSMAGASTSSTTASCSGFHLHRRHRRGHHPCPRQSRRRRKRQHLTRGTACSTSAITSRWHWANSSDDRAGVGPERGQELPADAAGRRACDLRRHAAARRLGGLCPTHAPEGGHRPLCRLVPDLARANRR